MNETPEAYILAVHRELERLSHDTGCANGPVRDILRKLGPPPQDRRGITQGGPLIMSGPADAIDQYVAGAPPIIVKPEEPNNAGT
jgi:hypothetical protein